MKKSILKITVTAAIAAMIGSGCGVENDDKNHEVDSFLDMFYAWGKQFKLTTHVLSGAVEGGAVSVSPRQDTYKPKSQVRLSAEEFDGFRFLGWTGDAVDSSAYLTVTMNKDLTLNANFLDRNIPAFPLNIAIVPQGAGTVSRNPSFTVYPVGQNVTVTATPLAGYRFIGWSGTVNDTNATTNIVTLDGGAGPTANFIRANATAYTLDVAANPADGGSTARNPNWTVYQSGDIVQISAAARTGYTFIGWSGDVNSANAEEWVTMNRNMRITANYRQSGTGGGGDSTGSGGGGSSETVTVGGATWMAKNLNIVTEDSWCYEDSPDSCAKYGRLYTWEAAKRVCQIVGMRLPTRREWGDLAIAAGGTGEYGNDGTAGKALRSRTGWDNNSNGGNGTDDYGFSALPGGFRGGGLPDDGFGGAGRNGFWWTATTEFGSNNPYVQGMGYNYGDYVGVMIDTYSSAFSVRCIADGGNVTPPPTDTTTTPPTDTTTTPPPPQGANVCGVDGTADGCRTVTIGGKMWMAENLNFETANGSSCYDDDPANCAKYGRLYTWSAAMNIDASYDDTLWGGSDVGHKGVCPTGWHLPSRREWGDLAIAAGGDGEYGDRYAAGNALKSTTGWEFAGDAYVGTDDFGFSALPGGLHQMGSGSLGAGENGHWWTATESNGGSDWAYSRTIPYINVYVGENYIYNHKGLGYSVRCIAD